MGFPREAKPSQPNPRFRSRSSTNYDHQKCTCRSWSHLPQRQQTNPCTVVEGQVRHVQTNTPFHGVQYPPLAVRTAWRTYTRTYAFPFHKPLLHSLHNYLRPQLFLTSVPTAVRTRTHTHTHTPHTKQINTVTCLLDTTNQCTYRNVNLL
jgi:hypothetical protein